MAQFSAGIVDRQVYAHGDEVRSVYSISNSNEIIRQLQNIHLCCPCQFSTVSSPGEPSVHSRPVY
jgi:hypothetical protein